MMYNTIQNFSNARSSGFSLVRRVVGSLFLCIFLIITILLYFLAFPAWQVRLNGVQTTAIAHADGVCSSDDDSSSGDSYSFSYSFTDAQGKHYQIARDSFCTNIIDDGAQVTVWYMANDPHTLLTTPEAVLLYIFSGLGGGVDLVSLVIILSMVIGGLRAKRKRETLNYLNMGLR